MTLLPLFIKSSKSDIILLNFAHVYLVVISERIQEHILNCITMKNNPSIVTDRDRSNKQ